MSHKRKGQLTVDKEWRKHLRKYGRRDFWGRERVGEGKFIKRELAEICHDRR